MTKHALTVVAYVFSTFFVQGTSHFAVAAKHYAAIPFMRAEPVFVLGFGSMLIQGTIMSLLHEQLAHGRSSIGLAIKHAWLLGAILVSYLGLAEAGKYAIPSLASWMAVEFAAAFVQFTLFGLLMGLIHRQFSMAKA